MAHRCEHLCSASQLWLPHLALCIVPPECFWGLRIWSGAVGSKSGKLWNVADHDTPTPTPKPPKVATPTLFSGTQDGLDHFKAECSLYLSMRPTEFMDKQSSILFVLLYMKGGSTGPWVTQKINRILDTANSASTMWAEFTIELDEMFVDPNCQEEACHPTPGQQLCGGTHLRVQDSWIHLWTQWCWPCQLL